MRLPKNCLRVDKNRLQIVGITPNTIFANEDVPVEDAAIDELASLLELETTAKKMWEVAPELFSEEPCVSRVSLSPDFHKGAGIPIGTTMLTKGMVIPQAVGNDINCGVRLHITSLTHKEVLAKLDTLEPRLRHLYFEGGRQIPLTQEQRYHILTQGLKNLPLQLNEGIWKTIDKNQLEKDNTRIRHQGGFDTQGKVWGLDGYLNTGITRDSQIGSIGGGNHFSEVQYVSKIHKGATAHHWGITIGSVVVMVHSGSVNVGHLCGEAYSSFVKALYPKVLKYPANGIFPLPNLHPYYPTFWTALHNAANFAFANRFFLSQLMRQAFLEMFGDHQYELVYDTPHNLAWQQEDGVLHRKGASPAGSFGDGPDEYFGEPVLMPGSMGSSSFLMEGLGNLEALATASHGAGRSLSRGQALHHSDAEFQKFLQEFRIITPIDPKRADLRNRRDILQKYYDDLKKEAPYAYKDIKPVVQTLTDARIAEPVAELRPIFTLKG